MAQTKAYVIGFFKYLSEFLDIATDKVNQVVTELTTALENYRAEHLKSLKPEKKISQKI
ncbi:hypothetical protein [Mucilaginibacter sp. UR6-11]|uniref:hypothetical protein n=1 Tax=Mucilaginibacter sp. UR6-11 TaxID=1435644 RepID=UPI001E4769F5|nr:hypothetical protein [Mucilaginibacter sp. UR6-11]MCC8427303.1 hypothetical protein [Mucilaginibacter sp. UR6-11]